MRIEFSKRATTDLEKIGRYYREFADPAIAAAIENRIRQVVARIARALVPDDLSFSGRVFMSCSCSDTRIKSSTGFSEMRSE